MPDRPTSLTEVERVIELLGDAVDQLESKQVIDPSPALEAVADNVRFARDTLARIQAAYFDALEDFVRGLRVTKPEKGDE